MSDIITIHGASGNTVTLQQGTDGGTNALALDMQKHINSIIEDGSSDVVNLDNNPEAREGDKIPVGIVEKAASLDLGGYQYIVVADSDDATYQDTKTSLNQDVILSTQRYDNNNTYLYVLSGRKTGVAVLAGNNPGQVINTTGGLYFDGGGKTSDWGIFAGDGDNVIRTGTGSNKVLVGGKGISHIISNGHDEIYVNSTAANTTLRGDNATLSAGRNGIVKDLGNNNHITAFYNTIVNAGDNGTIDFKTGINDSSLIGSNTVQGGTGNTISSTNSNITAIHGDNNNFNKLTDNLTLLNGSGDTKVTIEKQFVGFGASGLNLTLNNDVNNDNSSFFVADQGNETLNASGYYNRIEIYANTVTGAQTNFVATGGSGDDVLAAGTGNATFTGGAGNNLFMLNKDAVSNGTTVITDFANQNSDNHIGLYNYGLNQDDIAQLLKNSHNDDKGNALLNLDNHKVTIEGVSVADLKTSQFFA